VIHEYPAPVVLSNGAAYVVWVCGRRQDSGLWEAWFVFLPVGGGEALATDRETTQSKRADVRYWATGISAVYLEGALQRALYRRPALQRPQRLARAERAASLLSAELATYRAAADAARAELRRAQAERRDAARALDDGADGQG
jgi:hypothetical protein